MAGPFLRNIALLAAVLENKVRLQKSAMDVLHQNHTIPYAEQFSTNLQKGLVLLPLAR